MSVDILSRWTNAVVYHSEDVSELSAAVVEAIAKSVNLDGANLDGANLRGANLELSLNLDGANLDGANLDRANLDGANLDGANLRGANLDGAGLETTVIPNRENMGRLPRQGCSRAFDRWWLNDGGCL